MMNIITRKYDYLLLISMIYIAVDLSSMVFAYKIISIGPIIGAASSLIFPLTYSIMDVVAEVYGFKMAKKIILFAVICDFIFALMVLLIAHIPSSNQSETLAYILVLGSLLRSVLAQTIGVLIGGLINIYLISKWKIMTKGKYFWLRSIGSSTIGEAVMLIISVTIALTGILTFSKLLLLMMFTYLYKIVFAIIMAPLVSIAATFLNKKVNGMRLDDDINYTSILNKQDYASNFRSL